jgi:hypothetical protein
MDYQGFLGEAPPVVVAGSEGPLEVLQNASASTTAMTIAAMISPAEGRRRRNLRMASTVSKSEIMNLRRAPEVAGPLGVLEAGCDGEAGGAPGVPSAGLAERAGGLFAGAPLPGAAPDANEGRGVARFNSRNPMFGEENERASSAS